MSNMETFEYNPEMPSYETGWGGEAEYESEVFSEAEVIRMSLSDFTDMSGGADDGSPAQSTATGGRVT
jgi:hypothetical protein